MQRNATQRNATQRNATQHNTTQHNTIQYDAMRYETIPYDTIKCLYRVILTANENADFNGCPVYKSLENLYTKVRQPQRLPNHPFPTHQIQCESGSLPQQHSTISLNPTAPAPYMTPHPRTPVESQGFAVAY